MNVIGVCYGRQDNTSSNGTLIAPRRGAAREARMDEEQCTVCQEADPSVILECRDGHVYCADHALKMGYCWGCGEADPQWYGDDMSDGLCHDCRSADVMFDRKRRHLI